MSQSKPTKSVSSNNTSYTVVALVLTFNGYEAVLLGEHMYGIIIWIRALTDIEELETLEIMIKQPDVSIGHLKLLASWYKTVDESSVGYIDLCTNILKRGLPNVGDCHCLIVPIPMIGDFSMFNNVAALYRRLKGEDASTATANMLEKIDEMRNV